MKQSKLLERQLLKFFPKEFSGNEIFTAFLQAVNDSYNAYERDQELADRAFKISETEYIQINQQLKSEVNLKKLSISKLKEAIVEITGDSLEQSSDELLDIATYLNLQINNRRKAEEDLRRISLVASLNKNGILFTNAEGIITWSNEGFSKLTGYTADEINGKTPIDLLHGEETDPEELQKMISHFIVGENFDVELYCYRKDGTSFWGRATGQSVSDETGKVNQYFAMIEDVTMEKEAQKSLQEFEHRFRKALQRIGDNVWEHDFLTGKTYFSNTSNYLLGFAADKSVDNAKLWWQQTHPEDKGLLLENDAKYKSGIIDHHVLEYRILYKDGSVRWILDRGVVIEKQANGKPLKIVGTHTDITERKLSEQALRINEEKYRGIIANMNLGLLEVDTNEKIQYANQSFCNMSGFDLEELVGKNASTLFAKGANSELLDAKNELRKKHLSDAYEIAVKNKRGELKWWLISGAPRYNDSGELIGSIGIHLDITEQKQLEIELYDARITAEHSTKAKEMFLANMSHEIRTPMNAILGMSRQLTKTELNETQHFYLDTIGKAAEHLLIVINDILDISKIEAGKMTLENIAFKPKDVIAHCMQVMQHKADEKGLKLIKEGGEGICPVLIGDPHRLTQILLNLISNAVKFTNKGSVSIMCKLLDSDKQRQKIYISVKDTGIGMDEEFMSNLFQTFTQEDKTTARKYGGTGLGMAISKQLVELMNGSIAVKSKKNEGTEIILTIPFVIGNEKELEKDKRNTGDYTILKGKKILLVEDNEMNRLVATTVLSGHGLLINEVENGKEAVDEIRHGHYDLILMDMQMPVMDGLEATTIIRKDGHTNIPIIALTANAITGESDRCREAGMNDFVSKPFEEQELLSAIIHWLSKTIKTENTMSPTDTTNSQPLYDLSKLTKIGNGNIDFVNKMIRLFTEQVPASVLEIREAYDKKDFTTVKSVAHRIKPAIDNMGIEVLHQPIRKIEHLALNEPGSAELPALVQLLEKLIQNVVTSLELIETVEN